MSSSDDEDAARLFSELQNGQVSDAPPEWVARQQGLINSPLVHYKPKGEEETAAFVLGDTGITPEEFDAESGKSLQKLHRELQREVRLAYNPASGKTREILRLSENARGIIYSPIEDLALCEVGRVVIDTAHAIIHGDEYKPFGCSETGLQMQEVRPGVWLPEPPVVTMERGYVEESGYRVPPQCLIPLTPVVPFTSMHDSSVFNCNVRHEDGTRKLLIRSVVVSRVFGLDITRLGMLTLNDWVRECFNIRQDGDMFLVEDEGVLLMFMKLPLLEPWRRLLKAKLAQHVHE